MVAVAGDLADAESLIALKDLFNRMGSGNLHVQEVHQLAPEPIRLISLEACSWSLPLPARIAHRLRTSFRFVSLAGHPAEHGPALRVPVQQHHPGHRVYAPLHCHSSISFDSAASLTECTCSLRAAADVVLLVGTNPRMEVIY